MAAVKLALLQHEAGETRQGIALDDTISHSILISMGLDLEEQQYDFIWFTLEHRN